MLLIILEFYSLLFFAQRPDQTGWLWFGPALQFRWKVRWVFSCWMYAIYCVRTWCAYLCKLKLWLNAFLMIESVMSPHHEHGFSSSYTLTLHQVVVSVVVVVLQRYPSQWKLKCLCLGIRWHRCSVNGYRVSPFFSLVSPPVGHTLIKWSHYGTALLNSCWERRDTLQPLMYGAVGEYDSKF